MRAKDGHPQPGPADNAPFPRDLYEAPDEGLDHLGIQEVREADQSLGIRHSLAVDPPERAADQAAAHLALAFVEASMVDALEYQQSEQDGGWGPRSAPHGCQPTSRDSTRFLGRPAREKCLELALESTKRQVFPLSTVLFHDRGDMDA